MKEEGRTPKEESRAELEASEKPAAFPAIRTPAWRVVVKIYCRNPVPLVSNALERAPDSLSSLEAQSANVPEARRRRRAS